MKLIQAIKAIQCGKGVVRCIDENGEVYSEHITDGISIDFIDARWLVKTGEVDFLIKKNYLYNY
jgi:hypothetical protein